MTARATGRLRATYISGGRRTRMSIRLRSRQAWTVRKRVPRGRRTGILVLRYAGDARVRPDALRSRVADGRALLRRTSSGIDGAGRLVVRGTVSRRARGVVRLRLDPPDESAPLQYRARLRRGRWTLRRLLPSKAASGGQLSIQYTGHLPRRIRGESLSKAVAR
jgi:hypothetical protein